MALPQTRAESATSNPGESTDTVSPKRIMTYSVYIRYKSDPEKIPVHMESLKVLTAKYSGFMVSFRSASMEIKIPAGRYMEFYEAIKNLDEVEYRDIHALDITDNYRNTEIRLNNARKLRERLEELLKKAQTVDDTISIEKELARVTETIEIHEAAIARYNGQVDNTSFHISFSKKSRPGPVGWIFYGLYKGIKWLIVWD